MPNPDTSPPADKKGGASRAGFGVGDLIEIRDGSLWEIVTPKPADIPAKDVTCGERGYMKRGKLTAYAVRGYLRRDWHEVAPKDIRRGWRLVTPNTKLSDRHE